MSILEAFIFKMERRPCQFWMVSLLLGGMRQVYGRVIWEVEFLLIIRHLRLLIVSLLIIKLPAMEAGSFVMIVRRHILSIVLLRIIVLWEMVVRFIA